MDKKKLWIIILSVIVGVLLLGGIALFFFFDISPKDSGERLLIDTDSNVNTNESSSDTDNDKQDESNDLEDDNGNQTNNNEQTGNQESNSNQNNENNSSDFDYIDSTEDDVVAYFENMETEVNQSSTFKEKFKEYFVTIIDFIFYDKEIKGYTFNELTDMAKIKVIAAALKMDSKLDELFPNYKETISSTASGIYDNIKGKLVTSYLDISTEVCKNNAEGCVKVKEIFSDIKSVCKITWEFIKELLKNAGSKLKEWYEIYRG